jgi:hypothetical protein
MAYEAMFATIRRYWSAGPRSFKKISFFTHKNHQIGSRIFWDPSIDFYMSSYHPFGWLAKCQGKSVSLAFSQAIGLHPASRSQLHKPTQPHYTASAHRHGAIHGYTNESAREETQKILSYGLKISSLIWLASVHKDTATQVPRYWLTPSNLLPPPLANGNWQEASQCLRGPFCSLAAHFPVRRLIN